MNPAMNIEIHRMQSHEETYGIPGEILVIDETGKVIHTAYTVEREWRDNAKNDSCIPAGDYRLDSRQAGRYYDAAKERWGHDHCFHVRTTEPERSLILIHWGCFPRTNSKGCILIGRKADVYQGQHVVWQSQAAYREFYNATLQGFRLSSDGSVPLKILNAIDDEAEEGMRTNDAGRDNAI